MFHSLYHNLQQQKQHADTSLPAESSILDISLDWPALYNQGFTPFTPEAVTTAHWSVSVEGLVETPATFTLEDFRAFTCIQQNRRIVHAEGLTYRTTWEGFVAAELLHRVSPLPEARYMVQYNAANEVECLPLQELYDHRALFCIAAQNKVLPVTHGGPFRLMVFNRYAHKGLGQIVKLVLTDEPVCGTFELAGYEKEGTITPGQYYACDLKQFETISESTEVENW